MKLRYPILAIAIASSAGTLQAQTLRGEDLVAKSPFVPADTSTPASQTQATTQQGDLEFRGVYSLGERYFFNVFDRRENKGTWMELNKEANGMQISGFDRDQRSIALNVGGRAQTLMMPRPSDQTMPVQLAAAPAPANNVRGGAPASPGDNNRVVRRTGTGNTRTINRTVPPPPPAVARPGMNTPSTVPRPPHSVAPQGTPGNSSFTPPSAGNNRPVTPYNTQRPTSPPSPPPMSGPPGPPPGFIPEIPAHIRDSMGSTPQR